MDAPAAYDVFFLIVIVATLAVTAILVRALIFVLGILRNAKKISDEARREVRAIAKDADVIRRDLQEGERSIRPTLRAVSRFFDGKKQNRHSTLPRHSER